MKRNQQISLILTILGILVTLYLSWSQLAQNDLLCAEGGGCSIVRQSSYAKIGAIPISLLGLSGYLGILLLHLAKDSWISLDNKVILIFGITLVGTLYSGYLTYLELFVIHAICPYCVISAILMTLIFILAGLRLREVMSSE